MDPSGIEQPFLSLNAKVVMFALANAALTALGIFFQKMNGVRAGNVFISGWLILATACFFPTFLITNKTFLMGGRMSLYVPVTGASYIFAMLLGRFAFGEAVTWDKWIGCGFIIAGIAALARG